MQYAPTVTDRSAEIYAQGANNATNIRAQGQANFQNSLTSSFNTAMGMVNKRIEKNETDNAKLKQTTATGQAMMNIADNYGADGQKFKVSLATALKDNANDANKMAGTVMAYANDLENLQKIKTAEKTYAALGNAYAGKAQAAADIKAAQPPKMNAETIRAYANDAATNGATPDQIKAALLQGYGQWAVDAVYPQPKQNFFWGP
jgi:hypothetical protein